MQPLQLAALLVRKPLEVKHMQLTAVLLLVISMPFGRSAVHSLSPIPVEQLSAVVACDSSMVSSFVLEMQMAAIASAGSSAC